MELAEFVSQTIKEIIMGVKNAQADPELKEAEINPMFRGGLSDFSVHGVAMGTNRKATQFVEFDVALTVLEGTGTKGGIGVFMGPLGLGSQGQSSSENTSVSRIKFKVPITLP